MDLIALALAIKKAKNYTDAAALVGVPVNYPEVDAVTGTWRVFDPVANAYIDTGIKAHGTDGTDGRDGAPGPAEISEATDVEGIDDGKLLWVEGGKVGGISPSSVGVLTPAEIRYLDNLIGADTLNRIVWQLTVTTTQIGSITTDWVYLQIIPSFLATSAIWAIVHNDGSVLARDGQLITYTSNEYVQTLVDDAGNVLNNKFHIPPGLTVTDFVGNPSGDLDNVRIIVEFDIHAIKEVLGDTDALNTDSKIVVPAINELRDSLSRIDDNDKLLSYSNTGGWLNGLTNDTHGGHIRLLDKFGAAFLDIDIAAYGSGLEAVCAIEFIGGEFSASKAYSAGDRAHYRGAVTLDGWPEVTECTRAYTANTDISAGAWNPAQWDLRDDQISGAQIGTYAQIARDGFIFVAVHQMTWDHEPTIDEFTPADWYLINRLPTEPGIYAIFVLDNDTGKVGWIAAKDLSTLTGTTSISIDPEGNISLMLNSNGLLSMTDNGLLLKWSEADGVLMLGTDTNTKLYTKAQVDTLLAAKQKKLDYSTTEVATGETYIDGKPIYRRTFTGTMPVTAADTKARITLMSGVEMLVNVYGNFINIDGTGTVAPVNAWYEGLLLASMNSSFFVDGSDILKLAFKCSAAITATSNMTYEITCEYTKA
ncbi:MAG: hypothetical protein LBK57_03805 [Clostridiales Family XIII bacterium]|jgi:hypothetical protein|nr:hypothetical protein [Clostridiales Family XIII bacterium]